MAKAPVKTKAKAAAKPAAKAAIKKVAARLPAKAPRKLSIIASKGSLDMAYPPLILANAARMSGIETNVFFTFWGLDIITKKKHERTARGCGRQSLHAPLVPHPDPAGCHPRHVGGRFLDDAR